MFETLSYFFSEKRMLTLSRQQVQTFLYYFSEREFDISICLLPLETIWMKCHVLFSGRFRKYYFLIWAIPCETVSSADREGPDQPAHPYSLIRTFTVHLQNHWILQYVWLKSNGPDDTLHMCRNLHSVHVWRHFFCLTWPISVPQYQKLYIWHSIRENLDQPVHLCSLVRILHCLPEGAMDPWQSIEHPAKIESWLSGTL